MSTMSKNAGNQHQLHRKYVWKKKLSVTENLLRTVNAVIIPMILRTRFKNITINPNGLAHIALFPKINIAFNRIKKNANSTSMIALSYIDRAIIENEKAAKNNSSHLHNTSIYSWSKINHYKFAIVVRNPYTRVLSAFTNKFAKKSYVDRYGVYDLSPSGFKKFLYWLKDGALSADAHWDLQKKLILLPINCYDFVIKFEEFPNKLVDFLNLNDINLTPDELKTLNLLPGNPTSASKLIEFYDDETKNWY